MRKKNLVRGANNFYRGGEEAPDPNTLPFMTYVKGKPRKQTYEELERTARHYRQTANKNENEAIQARLELKNYKALVGDTRLELVRAMAQALNSIAQVVGEIGGLK